MNKKPPLATGSREDDRYKKYSLLGTSSFLFNVKNLNEVKIIKTVLRKYIYKISLINKYVDSSLISKSKSIHLVI